MLESILIPDAIVIKNKDFLGVHIAEDEVLVEKVGGPEHLAWNDISFNLL